MSEKNKRILFLALAAWLIVSAGPTVAAAKGPHKPLPGRNPEPADDGPPACGNWNILIAYDEEMADTSLWFYKPFPLGPIPVGVETYVVWQTARGACRFLYEFDIHYYVVGVVEWESDDSLTTMYALLDDAVKKTGFHSGMDYDGTVVRVLVAWTNQPTEDNTGGAAGSCALIVNYQTPWADDNVVMHELSHLHGCRDHENNQGCVMDNDMVTLLGFYWEPLKPVYKGAALLDLAGDVPGLYINAKWCDECKETIRANPNPYLKQAGPPANPGSQALPPRPWEWTLIWLGSLALTLGSFGFCLYAITRLIKRILRAREARKRRT